MVGGRSTSTDVIVREPAELGVVSDIWQGRRWLRACAGLELPLGCGCCVRAVAVHGMQPAEVLIRTVDVAPVGRPQRTHRAVVTDSGATVMVDIAYRVTMGPTTSRAVRMAVVGEGMPAEALPQDGVGPRGDAYERWRGIRDRRIGEITALEGHVTSYVRLSPLALRLR